MDTQTKNQVAGIIDRARRLKAEKEQKLMQVRQAAELSLAPNLRTPNAIDAQFAAEWEKESKAFYEELAALRASADALAAKLSQRVGEAQITHALEGYLLPDSSGVKSADLQRARVHVVNLHMQGLLDFYQLAINVGDASSQLAVEECFSKMPITDKSTPADTPQRQLDEAIRIQREIRRTGAGVRLGEIHKDFEQATLAMTQAISEVDSVERTKKLAENPRYSLF